ncbi:MAG: leucine-rich repeat domain-containing protein [Clostridia bacterium]|nr:leucine-rich repeat domain-containing protein [Clostridia bacterium]
MKRTLSLLLALLLLTLGALPLSGCDKNELEFILLADGTYGVRAVRPDRIEVLTVPESHEGVAVTALLPRALEGAARLTEVTLPEGIKTLGDAAFAGCTALTAITLPSSLTYVGSSVFDGCTALAYTEWEGAYYLGNAEAPTLYLAAVKSRGITEATLPSGVRFIASRAFYDCRELASVTLPSDLLSVGAEAFGRCTALRRVEISDLSAFCRIAFADEAANPAAVAGALSLNVTPITALTVPEGVTAIGDFAFLGLPLTEITLPTTLVSVGDYALAGTAVTALTLPSSLTVIGEGAFRHAAALTEVTLPAALLSIGRDAFYGCTALTSATLQNTEGWYVDGVPLPPEDIATPAATAASLSGVYTDSVWTRKEK